MTRATLLLTTLLATFSMGAAAQGQNPGMGSNAGSGGGQTDTGPNQSSFDDFDTDRNDYIDEREARDGGLDNNWNELDANRDNNVDRSEFDTFQRDNQSGQGAFQPNRTP